jgi:hypothetical protein
MVVIIPSLLLPKVLSMFRKPQRSWSRPIAGRRMFRKSGRMRSSHLAAIVLPDRDAAMSGYRLLQHHGISPEHIAIVGYGYNTPEQVGILRPLDHGIQFANRTVVHGWGFGFAVGLVFVVVILLGGIPMTGQLLIIIPLLGITFGFLSAMAGSIVGFCGEGYFSGLCRFQLRQGRYLIMIEGTEKLVIRGQDILGEFWSLKI